MDYTIDREADVAIPARVKVTGGTAPTAFEVQCVPFETGDERPADDGWVQSPVTSGGLAPGYYCVFTRHEQGGQTFVEHAPQHIIVR